MKIISQGAEATIYKIGNKIAKERLPKSYRLKKLDNKIRIQRARKEAKLMTKASKITNVPKPYHIPHKSRIIHIPYIKGKKLSEYLDKLDKKISEEICIQIGESIAKLHDNNIIHGDLTTSNMIFDDKKTWFIDFGLGFSSEKIEDKAVDLHLIKQALEAKHYKNFNFYWENIEKGYNISKNAKDVFERLKKVESRGRYKERY